MSRSRVRRAYEAGIRRRDQARLRLRQQQVRECRRAAIGAEVTDQDSRDFWIATQARYLWTQTVIGLTFGVSRQRVHQIIYGNSGGGE